MKTEDGNFKTWKIVNHEGMAIEFSRWGEVPNYFPLDVKGPRGGHYGFFRLTPEIARELAADLLEAAG